MRIFWWKTNGWGSCLKTTESHFNVCSLSLNNAYIPVLQCVVSIYICLKSIILSGKAFGSRFSWISVCDSFIKYMNDLIIQVLRLLKGRNTTFRSRRQFMSAVMRQALKLRYWIATGVLGTGVAVSNVSLYTLRFCSCERTKTSVRPSSIL